MSWLKFISIAAIFYMFMNLFFACLYTIFDADILNLPSHSLWHYFVFSFQTSSTIGYGHYLPVSDLAHKIVIFDTLTSVFYMAVITGLVFSKFAKPNAEIAFTDKIILTTFNETPALMYRMANARDTHIVDAHLTLGVLLHYTSSEGHKMRRNFKLNLLTKDNPAFALSWTAIHIMDQDSPLFGMDYEQLLKEQVIFYTSLSGIDEVMSQTVHASKRYTHLDLIRAFKFKDMLTNHGGTDFSINFKNFNETQSQANKT